MICFLPAVLITLVFLCCRVHCSIEYLADNGTCTTFQSLGKSEFCCNGNCIDNTLEGNPGACSTWDSPCLDPAQAPSCSSTQIMHGPNYDYPFTIVGGSCYGNNLCQWTKMNWTWSCCDCPEGYVNPQYGSCGVGGSPDCVKCTDPREVLVGIGANISCVIPTSTSSSSTASKPSSGKSSSSSSKLSSSSSSFSKTTTGLVSTSSSTRLSSSSSSKSTSSQTSSSVLSSASKVSTTSNPITITVTSISTTTLKTKTVTSILSTLTITTTTTKKTVTVSATGTCTSVGQVY